MCGWLKDKFGLSWQIIPTILAELMSDKDPTKAGRVMNAMLQMKKIDIKALKDAYGKRWNFIQARRIKYVRPYRFPVPKYANALKV